MTKANAIDKAIAFDNSLLPDVADDATTVVLERMADVDPVGDGAVLVLAMLHDALVELSVIDYPIHPILQEREGLRWRELLAAVAAGDDHRTVEVTTQWFEDFLTEATEIVDSRGRWGVVDASG